MRVDDSLVPVLLVDSYIWALRNHACGRLLGACPACGFLYLGSKKSCGWTTPWCVSCLRFPILGLQGLQETMRVDDSLVPVLLAVCYTWDPRNLVP